MKRILPAFLLTLFFCPLLANAENLEITGAVVAYELSYGHSYSLYKTEEALRKYLVVRVDQLSKGNEKLKYILVSFDSSKGQVNFNNKSLWKFKLSKRESCSSTLKDIQFVFLGNKKVSGIQPRLRRTKGHENEVLPMTLKLPCFGGNLKGMREYNSVVPESNNSEKSAYVLEDSLWTDLPHSPLAVFFGGADEFTNTTSKTISEFNLGCVTDQNNEFQLKHIFEVNRSTVRPKDTIFSVNNANLAPSMNKLYTCYQIKAKLTAVRIKFEDDSIWEFK